MNFKVKRSSLSGTIFIPPSKSHTIRAVIIAALAKGKSVIHEPLKSDDTLACLEAIKQLGAEVEVGDNWTITGFNGIPKFTEDVIDLKNSGTSLRMIASIVALCDGEMILDGDESLRTRPMKPLLDALLMLGAETAESVEGNGCAPIKIRGKINGGIASVDGKTSQFMSSMLLVAPVLKRDSDLKVVKLNERPYMDMTVAWMKKMGVEISKKGRNGFFIPGNQTYYSFETIIPGDFSSATFPLIAALITEGSDIVLKGLDLNDTQGDKRILELVKEMGADVSVEKGGGIRIKYSELEGIKIDLNENPDALPALAVLGCFAKGTTQLFNVSQARIKETDRIKLMFEELKKMGAKIEELEDGLKIKQSTLIGTKVNGHSDHRIVMALSLAAMNAEGETVISTAESVDVTFPNYAKKMKSLGADIK